MATFSLQDEINLAQLHVDAMKRAQAIAPIGFGTTLCDVLACGVVRAAATHESIDMGLAFSAYHYTHWYQGGVPRIRLSHGLATKLALTDPTGVDSSEIRLPFPVFAIELPFPNGPIVMESGNDSSVVQDATMLYISSYDDSSTNDRIDDDDADTNEEVLRRIHAAKLKRVFDQRCVYVALCARDQTRFHARMELREAIEFDGSTLIALAEHSRRALVLGYRIVANLALYLKSLDSSSPLGSGKIVNHDHGLHSLLYEIGKEVKLERNLRDAARSYCRTGEANAKWKLEKRFIVRGHWKYQAHGSGHAERKLIFVEPYWKGPADAPVLARTYVDKS